MSIDIAVVTSVWGDYARYLPAWAQSVADQSFMPRQVAILDAGVSAPGPLFRALDILEHAGLDVRFGTAWYSGIGAARNAAVGLVDTEWVMHLDADDRLLPYALADVDRAHRGFDVVSLGALHQGRPRVFPDITAEGILARQHGVFSCGAFRRELWAQRPWHTRNDWVDSVFWVGLAHLGANFTSTGRVGFDYRCHDDSVSRSWSHTDRQRALKQWRDACREWTLN